MRNNEDPVARRLHPPGREDPVAARLVAAERAAKQRTEEHRLGMKRSADERAAIVAELVAHVGDDVAEAAAWLGLEEQVVRNLLRRVPDYQPRRKGRRKKPDSGEDASAK